MSAIPLSEVGVLDRNAEALGVSIETLMENAGEAVARFVGERVESGTVIAILAGPGNNGGDGFVAARHLAAAGHRVRIVTPVAGPDGLKTEHARRAYDALPSGVERIHAEEEAQVASAVDGAVIVDALLGAGIRGLPREPYASYVRAANASQALVVSVDVPTGLGSILAIRASETITFHAPKEGMGLGEAGHVTVADIGIPAAAATHTGPGEMLLYPRPRIDQHKGEGGVVLVIGGGPYTGAPAVAGLAALRAGADIAIVLTPRSAWSVVASYSPNLIVRPLNNDMLDFTDPANRVALNQWLKKADAVLVGSGVGLSELAFKSVHHAVERALAEGVPVVADAEAIPALAAKPELVREGVLVSAHAREFESLTGDRLPEALDARAALASAHAMKRGAAFIVKGPTDVIAAGERVKFNATGHPAMSVAGTGDVLAGVATALLAKHMRPFDAGRVAAYMTGKAGEIAADESSFGLVATDVMEALPRVLRNHFDTGR